MSKGLLGIEDPYFLRMAGTLVLRRLQMEVDNTVSITSDNAAYAARRISIEELKRLETVGRIVWIGRQAEAL